MRRYDHGGDIYGSPDVRYDFSVNTNPLGMPGEVSRALAERIGGFPAIPIPIAGTCAAPCPPTMG